MLVPVSSSEHTITDYSECCLWRAHQQTGLIIVNPRTLSIKLITVNFKCISLFKKSFFFGFFRVLLLVLALTFQIMTREKSDRVSWIADYSERDVTCRAR